MSKRAQISMNTIVYVSIALLVLILIVAFTTGGLGNLFGQVTETGPGELDSAKARCTSICSTAKTEVATSGHSGWTTSAYCTEEFSVDVDGDGDISSNEILNCWDSPISTDCSTTDSTALGTLSLTKVECNSLKYDEALGRLQAGA